MITIHRDTCTTRFSACVAEQFTGKERDAESGLDNFGKRYYGSSAGGRHLREYNAAPFDAGAKIIGGALRLAVFETWAFETPAPGALRGRRSNLHLEDRPIVHFDRATFSRCVRAETAPLP